ncbi:hypothetical protein D3C80_1630600 [compost metagenome]
MYIVSVSFSNDHSVGHLHDASFDTLQFISGTGQHEQEKEVGDLAYFCFALTNPYCFYNNGIKACSFAE